MRTCSSGHVLSAVKLPAAFAMALNLKMVTRVLPPFTFLLSLGRRRSALRSVPFVKERLHFAGSVVASPVARPRLGGSLYRCSPQSREKNLFSPVVPLQFKGLPIYRPVFVTFIAKSVTCGSTGQSSMQAMPLNQSTRKICASRLPGCSEL